MVRSAVAERDTVFAGWRTVVEGVENNLAFNTQSCPKMNVSLRAPRYPCMKHGLMGKSSLLGSRQDGLLKHSFAVCALLCLSGALAQALVPRRHSLPVY